MTANQLKLREIRATEARNEELKRANLAAEKELNRSNIAREQETIRSNKVNELTREAARQDTAQYQHRMATEAELTGRNTRTINTVRGAVNVSQEARNWLEYFLPSVKTLVGALQGAADTLS